MYNWQMILDTSTLGADNSSPFPTRIGRVDIAFGIIWKSDENHKLSLLHSLKFEKVCQTTSLLTNNVDTRDPIGS